MPSRPLAVFAVLAVAGLLAGCGATPANDDSGDKFQGQQRLVANTVEDLQSAASDADQDKICRDILARALADRLAARGGGCPAVVDDAVRDADAFDLTVESVQVTGDRATARVRAETGDKDRRYSLQLVRERGVWRIAAL
jgi:hypothetical protein